MLPSVAPSVLPLLWILPSWRLCEALVGRYSGFRYSFSHLRENFSTFSYTSMRRTNARRIFGVSLSISTISFAFAMNSLTQISHISISAILSVILSSSCLLSLCFNSYPHSSSSYRLLVMRPTTLSSYRQRMILSISSIRLSKLIRCLFVKKTFQRNIH